MALEKHILPFYGIVKRDLSPWYHLFRDAIRLRWFRTIAVTTLSNCSNFQLRNPSFEKSGSHKHYPSLVYRTRTSVYFFFRVIHLFSRLFDFLHFQLEYWSVLLWIDLSRICFFNLKVPLSQRNEFILRVTAFIKW